MSRGLKSLITTKTGKSGDKKKYFVEFYVGTNMVCMVNFFIRNKTNILVPTDFWTFRLYEYVENVLSIDEYMDWAKEIAESEGYKVIENKRKIRISSINAWNFRLKH